MLHRRQMWNQSDLWIQNNRIKMAQVLRGWNAWWKWHRASEGHQQRDHYANVPPLCLTSNNTALYICKGWQDTVHTALLSERSHARMVTPNGWPLSAMRLLGQTSHFIQTHIHWQKLSLVAHFASQGSNVAGRWDRPLFLRHLETCQKLNTVIWFLELLSSLLRWKVLD